MADEQKILQDIKRLYKQEPGEIAVPQGFATSIMREVRTVAAEEKQRSQKLEIFLWRMTYLPTMASALIFAFSFAQTKVLEDLVITQIVEMHPGFSGIVDVESVWR